MTITIPPSGAPAPSAEVVRSIDAACARIAPTWPLDQFIAVNPYWGWRTSTIEDAAARLGVLAGTPLTMPRAWFRDEWRSGRLSIEHLDAAAAAVNEPALACDARTVLEGSDSPAQPALQRLALVTDVRDRGAAPLPGRTWTDLVVHQIGQHCAAHFDEWQTSWTPGHGATLFSSWRIDPSVTHGFTWRHGSDWARSRLESLPVVPPAAVAAMLDDLGVTPAGHETYLTAVLASVNGWAAWCAYQRWQARLGAGDDDTIVDLLAIRLGWEWLLAADADDTSETIDRSRPADRRTPLGRGWAQSWSTADTFVASTAHQQRIDWLLQTAADRSHQDTIISGLATPGNADGTDNTDEVPADVQAVFCIDVRSEVIRRAIEATTAAVHTRGFAGFFGLPIAYTPIGSALTRPQLPGLLSPAMEVSEIPADAADRDAWATERARALGGRQRWSEFRREPSSIFSFVESIGLVYGAKLVKESLPHQHAPGHWEDDGLGKDHRGRAPRLVLVDEDPAAAAALAQRVLTGMGLLDGFAPLVMLCGHGSRSANNPHAAGLDCGACGGQTGEVNARVLADVLNAPAVRAELVGLGIEIRATTWFVAALHNTTTDTIELFDTTMAPASHRDRLDRLAGWLIAAGHRSRAERAESLGLGHLVADPRRLERRVLERANDWSQVRPEWGLAGNAAFVVAPRSRTRHLDLQGRCFLHDYDWRLDADLSVLTMIMTAPMVVTNWINMQYHASTVDNRRYGSGNKVLHNVVGGRIGVFEGNGGDLRIGLAMQSLHDGHTLRHRPLRLSVFIEAPQASIDTVVAQHDVVRDLVTGGWLHLLRIDPSSGVVERRQSDGWQPAPA